jgi:uncharacterized protein involved in tellurium resistance
MGINLAKGQTAVVDKTGLIKITTTWQSDKDYDVMALVKYKDGHIETVCAVNNEKMQTNDGAVKHLGDIGVGGGPGTEVIEVRLNDNIDEIVPFAYSAIENGSGSFREYGVSVAVDNGTNGVDIGAADTSADGRCYTCAFARIKNGINVSIENIEQYSARNSEKRPAFVNGALVMDAGPENHTK